METTARIFTTRAGRHYEFHADPLTAAAVLQLVRFRSKEGSVTLLHAVADSVDGDPSDHSYVWLPLTSPSDLVIHSPEPWSSVGDVPLRRKALSQEHERFGFVTLHEESALT